MHRGQRKKGASKKVRTWHPKVSQRRTTKDIAAMLKRQSSWAWHALLIAFVMIHPGNSAAGEPSLAAMQPEITHVMAH